MPETKKLILKVTKTDRHAQIHTVNLYYIYKLYMSTATDLDVYIEASKQVNCSYTHTTQA